MSTIWILEERLLPIGHGGVPVSAIARAAGAHLYLDAGDVVHADERFVFVSTGAKPGPRTVRLPAEAQRVVEIVSGAVVSSVPCREFDWPMKERSTYAFDTKP